MLEVNGSYSILIVLTLHGDIKVKCGEAMLSSIRSTSFLDFTFP